MRVVRARLDRFLLALLILIPAAELRSDPGDDLYNLALGEIRQKRFELAAKSLEELIEKHPQHPKTEIGRLRLGITYQSLKQHEPARKHLREFVRRNPANQNLGEAMYRVAFSSFHLDDMEHAEREFLAFHEKFPQHEYREWSLVYLGYAQLQNGTPEQAGQHFEAALQAFPEGEMLEDAEFGAARVLESTGKLEQAASRYRQLSQRSEGSRGEQSLMKLGSIRFEQEKFDESAQAYDELASKFPRSNQLSSARMYAGYAYFRAGRHEQARQRFAAAAQTESQSVTANYWKGLSEKTLGQYAEAVGSLSTAAEALPENSPQSASIRYHWADAEYLQGHYAEAEPLFLAALEADPRGEIADAALHRAALSSLARNNPQRAAELVARFRSEFPQSPLGDYITLLAGQIQIATAGEENLQAAEASLRKLLAEAESESLKQLARYQLARSLEQQNRYEPALETLAPLIESIDEQSSPDLHAALLLQADCQRRLAQQSLEAARPLRAQIATFEASDATTRTDELKQQLTGIEQASAAQAALAIASLDRFSDLSPAAGRTAAVPRIRAICEAIRGDETRLQAALEAHASLAAPNDSAQAALEAAEILYDRTEHAAAARLFATIAAEGVDANVRSQALSGLGWSHFKQQQYESAGETFARLATEFADHPLAPEASFQHANSLRLAGNTAEAQQAFAALLERFEQLSSTERTPALEEFARKAGLEAARLARQASRAEVADQFYSRVHGLFPRMPNLEAFLYEWAVANANAERFEQSDEVFRLLIRKFPQTAHRTEARLILAESDAARGKLDDARSALVEIVNDEQTADPLRKNALSHLVRIELTRRDWNEVSRWSALFAETYPSDPFRYDAQRYLAEALLFQEKDTEAEKILSRLYDQRDDPVLKDVPWRPQLWILLAEASVRLKNYDRVDALAKELASVEGAEPFRYQMWEVHGRSLKNRAKFAEAREAYQAAIDDKHGQKTETAAKCQFYLGEISLLRENYDAALEEFLKVYLLYNFPKWQAPALYQAGQCDEKLSHVDKALTSYEDLLRDFPDSEFAPLAQKRIAALKK
jgi:cellulose synthase operon protein C